MHKKLVIVPIIALMFILFIGAENPYINNLEMKTGDIANRIATSVQNGFANNNEEKEFKKIPGVYNAKTIIENDTLYIALKIDEKWNDRNSIKENIRLKIERINDKIRTAYLFIDSDSYDKIEKMKTTSKGYIRELNELVITKDYDIIKIR